MNNLLLYCRPGFEKEAAAEITERAGNMQCYGFARVKDDSGYVIFELYDEEQADLLARKLPFRELIFIRQMLVVTHELKDLEISDRVSPIWRRRAVTPFAVICGWRRPIPTRRRSSPPLPQVHRAASPGAAQQRDPDQEGDPEPSGVPRLLPGQ